MEIQPASFNSEFSDRQDFDNSFKAKPTNAAVGWLMLHYIDEYGKVVSKILGPALPYKVGPFQL